ncbi:hypothetical protein P6166_12640 [Stenotrophomonas sp. HITSZ_GD]|uniref:hypothetical protein n=1 Tax=Stenotrophomonas sp. HITSZ_GD TaxID=3037248 RepID=UPI00240CE816|nr:hypothetical protein [Stenotrophomonas sp. HITSZ_GD]MDG2526203.1 hypothetical protein [Stenotrophomonas sp. HITSZ_GD]
MSARRWWLGGAAAIALGLAVVLAVRACSPRATGVGERDAPRATPVHTAATPAIAEPAATPQADDAPPPWLRDDASPTTPPTAAAVPAEDPERARQMAALQQSVQGLVGVARQRSIASEAYMRQALATLEQMNDPAITAQINLAAVRQNLETSIRMQQVSEQLQQVMGQPPSEQRQQRQQALLAQLRQLQGQLRSDVRATPAGTVP